MLCLQRSTCLCLLGLGCGEKLEVTWFDMDWPLLVLTWKCWGGMLGRCHTSCPSSFCPSTFRPEFGKYKALEWVPSLAGGRGWFWWHPGLLVMGQEHPASQQSLSLPLASCQDEPSPVHQLPCLAFAIQPLLSRYFGKSKVPFHGL